MSAARIPIRNVYYLLCYAWNHLKQAEIADVARIPGERVLDLLAAVLCQGVEHLARRGLEQGYETREEVLVGVRGRVDASGSARRFLLRHGKASCVFDELTADTLPNRIVKSTLRLFERLAELHPESQRRVRALHKSLPGISEITLNDQAFRLVQLHSNNRYYRFLICVCKLVRENSFVDPESGSWKFNDFVRDERAMAAIFQSFLYNFVRLEIPEWKVSRQHIAWDAVGFTDPDLAYLPRMETDITLRRDARKLIVDAKYYRKTMSERYGIEKFHSENIYQLMSYLSNSERSEGECLSGMLVYPQAGRAVDERYLIQGFDVSIRTIDLDQPWHGVKDDMLGMFK